MIWSHGYWRRSIGILHIHPFSVTRSGFSFSFSPLFCFFFSFAALYKCYDVTPSYSYRLHIEDEPSPGPDSPIVLPLIKHFTPLSSVSTAQPFWIYTKQTTTKINLHFFIIVNTDAGNRNVPINDTRRGYCQRSLSPTHTLGVVTSRQRDRYYPTYLKVLDPYSILSSASCFCEIHTLIRSSDKHCLPFSFNRHGSNLVDSTRLHHSRSVGRLPLPNPIPTQFHFFFVGFSFDYIRYESQWLRTGTGSSSRHAYTHVHVPLSLYACVAQVD